MEHKHATLCISARTSRPAAAAATAASFCARIRAPSASRSAIERAPPPPPPSPPFEQVHARQCTHASNEVAAVEVELEACITRLLAGEHHFCQATRYDQAIRTTAVQGGEAVPGGS
jgi:hypothetical protein